jgi:hypothetical protein
VQDVARAGEDRQPAEARQIAVQRAGGRPARVVVAGIQTPGLGQRGGGQHRVARRDGGDLGIAHRHVDPRRQQDDLARSGDTPSRAGLRGREREAGAGRVAHEDGALRGEDPQDRQRAPTASRARARGTSSYMGTVTAQPAARTSRVRKSQCQGVISLTKPPPWK